LWDHCPQREATGGRRAGTAGGGRGGEHILADGAALDCVLLDLSPAGAPVYLIARIELPDAWSRCCPAAKAGPWRR
jgi:hypothetical protein